MNNRFQELEFCEIPHDFRAEECDSKASLRNPTVIQLSIVNGPHNDGTVIQSYY